MIRRRHALGETRGRASFEAPNLCARAPLERKRLSFAAALSAVAFVSAPQRALAQCAANPTNGGILQNGGAPCTVGGNVTVGFGTAVTASSSANVTTNGAVTANGGGTGISATTSAIVTANGPVTAAGIGLSASSAATIILNGIVVGNTGGGAMAMIADDAMIIANGVTLNWPNGFGSSLVEAVNGGLIEFNPASSITIPSGGFGAPLLLATGAGSRITGDGLDLVFSE
jgi:hypothetical protein